MEGGYEVYFYKNSQNNRKPVEEYLLSISKKERAKVDAYIQLLIEYKGILDEPYSKYLVKGIRELRPRRNRVLYALVEGRKIILLHAFVKTTGKTPRGEIQKAVNNFDDYKKYSNKALDKYN